MSKIYQKMYLTNKSRSKGVLGGFIHKVILRSFYSESYPLSFKRTGFTLIELLVVVLIIGILAAIALPQYEKAVEKSRAAESLLMLRSIAQANRVYFMTTGQYARDINDLDIEIPGTDSVYAGYNRKQTKYFDYGTVNASYPTTSIAVSNRLPMPDTPYWFTVFADKSGVYCKGISQKGKELCIGLSGGKQDGALYVIE